MALEARIYLYDIQQSIKRLEKIINGKTFETYASDETLVWAVERGLSITW
jgi:uncharacterized protein with HEPN domain